MSFLMDLGTPYIALRFKKKPWFRKLYQSAARIAAGPVMGGWGVKDWDRREARRRMQWMAVAAPTAIGIALGGPYVGAGVAGSAGAYGAHAGKEQAEDIFEAQEYYQQQQAAAAELTNTLTSQRELSGVAAQPPFLRSSLPAQAATPQYPLPYPDVPLQYPQPAGYAGSYAKAGDIFKDIFRRTI